MKWGGGTFEVRVVPSGFVHGEHLSATTVKIVQIELCILLHSGDFQQLVSRSKASLHQGLMRETITCHAHQCRCVH